MKGLSEKRTSERTEEELERAYETYILSKTVNGRYCPTPDLFPDTESSEDVDCTVSGEHSEGTRDECGPGKKSAGE